MKFNKRFLAMLTAILLSLSLTGCLVPKEEGELNEVTPAPEDAQTQAPDTACSPIPARSTPKPSNSAWL